MSRTRSSTHTLLQGRGLGRGGATVRPACILTGVEDPAAEPLALVFLEVVEVEVGCCLHFWPAWPTKVAGTTDLEAPLELRRDERQGRREDSMLDWGEE